MKENYAQILPKYTIYFYYSSGRQTEKMIMSQANFPKIMRKSKNESIFKENEENHSFGQSKKSQIYNYVSKQWQAKYPPN